MGLCFFFLIFGTLLMRIFGVPLRMVRIVGGIILMKIGIALFSPVPPGSNDMLMFGPGAIATVLAMTSKIRQSPTEL